MLALSLISVGNGFFKPNISTIVGTLYDQGDRRRDSGFTIFYMGINLGSILGQLFCPLLADWFGWWAGLSLAGVGMLISYALIQFDGGRLGGYGERPGDAPEPRHRDLRLRAACGAGRRVPVQQPHELAAAAEPGSGFIGYLASLSLMGKLLFGTFIIAVPGILAWSFAKGTRQEAQMMTAAMILIIFNVFFWTLFEQAGSSLTLFADRNTDRSVFGLFSISAPQTQNFNPISIVLLRAADEHLVDLAGQARARAFDPGQVLDRAWSASAPASCSWSSARPSPGPATTSRSACGGWPASTSSIRWQNCASRRSD